MKKILKQALSLFLIAVIVTALVAFMRNRTLEPIEKQRAAVQDQMMRVLLKSADSFQQLDAEKTGSIVNIYEGLNNNQTLGYIVELAPSGYSGTINIMVGISKKEENISGMRILKLSETPGLGALALKEDFYKRFDNKKLVELKVTRSSPADDEIQAITSATITSRTVTNAVNEAITWYKQGGVK